MRASVPLLALLVAAGCRSYPLPSTPGVHASDHVETGGPNSALRFKAAVCSGMSLDPEIDTLSPESFVAFLTKQGANVRLVNERTDLIYADLEVAPGERARLRVAVLKSPAEAGEELRKALDEQGKGAWGVHRGNIAILAPRGHLDDIVALVVKTRLACWGVVTIQDGSEAYVIPGGYLEF